MIARAPARLPPGSVLNVSLSGGESVEFTVEPGETLESVDALGAEALRAQVAIGDFDDQPTQPGRVDHDVDRKPRVRPKAGHDKK